MKFTKKVLKNGMRIITIPLKGNPTATVLVLVEAGSKYERKDNNGISHFLEHMCFKGTQKRPNYSDLAKELDALGSHYNAFTGHEYTGYYAKSNYKNFDSILDIVSDLYLNPTLPDKEIEKEKGVIIEEINMYSDLPQRQIQEEFMKLLYGDQPAGWGVAGPKENITKMKRSDFIDYRNKHYVASATTVVVAGRIDEKDAIKKITKSFKGIGIWAKEEKAKVVEVQKNPQVALIYKDTDQTHLIVGVRTYNTYNKYNTILRVLEGVLSGGMSSRLFARLRDELGLCYYVHADNETFTDHGVMAIAAGVDTKRVKEAIQAILAELNTLRTVLVSKEELDKTKQHLIGMLHLELESSDAMAGFYGHLDILRKDLKTPEEKEKEIRSVTAEEIKYVAERIFKNETLNLAIIGKFKDKREFADILKF